MKITKRQLRRIIKEEKQRIHAKHRVRRAVRRRLREQTVEPKPAHVDHGWPTVSWEDANELVDKWRDMELGAFDPGDPSMNQAGELSDAEAKKWWTEQVENAALELENVLADRLRQAALQTMQEVTARLINGDFA